MLPHPHPAAVPPAPFPRLARPANPLAAAVRAEALARLPDVLPPAVYAGVAAYLDGADHLPAAVADEVRGRFTATEFAELLGLVARLRVETAAETAAEPTAGPSGDPTGDAVPPPDASPGVRRVETPPEARRADCLAMAARDPHGRGPEFWERTMYPPGVGTFAGPTADGRGLTKDLADGCRPTLVRPGCAVADTGHGPGIVLAVTAARCVVRYPGTGEVRRLRWWEVMVDQVAPDPAYLTDDPGRRRSAGKPAPQGKPRAAGRRVAARAATPAVKGGAPCGR